MSDELNNENEVIDDENIDVIPEEDITDDSGNDDTVTEDPPVEEPTVEVPTEEPTQEISPTNFRIIEFSNVDDSPVAIIKEIVTDSEGVSSKHIYEFKTKATDIVNLYELNQEIINSETNVIETEISVINDQISSQNSTLTSLREEQQTVQTSYDEKQNEVIAFEDSHRTVPEENPEGEPYFDAERLDSEASEEYAELTSALSSINDELVRISGEITEAENLLDYYNSNLEAKQIQLNTLNDTISPDSVNDSMPTKYLQAVESNVEYVTPDMFIEVIISGDDVPDFSDTETNNTPYY